MQEYSRILPAVALSDRLRGCGYPWNKVWDLRRTGGVECFDEDLFSYEDKLWCVRMYRRCSRILLMPDIFYDYFQTEESLSREARGDREKARRKRANALKAYDRILEELPQGSPAALAAALFRAKTVVMGKIRQQHCDRKRTKTDIETKK